MSVQSEVLNLAPEAAATTFFIGGIIVDKVLARHGDERRMGYMHTQGITDAELEATQRGRRPISALPLAQATEQEPNLLEQARNIRWVVPASMALAAGLAVDAWTPNSVHHTQKPLLEVIAQHDFSVGSLGNGDGSYKKINSVFDELQATGKLRLNAVVAQHGDVSKVSIRRLESDLPFGPSSMPQTVKGAIAYVNQNSEAKQLNTIGSGQEAGKNAALLTIVDGTEIGSNPAAVIDEAKANGNLPVYIANVGNNTDTTAQGLKQIAKETGGTYWDASKHTKAVAQKIEQTITPRSVPERLPTDDKLWEKFLTALAVGVAAGAGAWRARVQFWGREKKQVSPKKEQ